MSPDHARTALWIGDLLAAALLDGGGALSFFSQAEKAPVLHSHHRLSDMNELAMVCADANADMIFISLAAGIEDGVETEPVAFEALLTEAVGACPTEAHVFFIVPSTLVASRSEPGVVHRLTPELHRRNIAAVSTAAAVGVSIIDLDRLVAEVGGHVAVGPARYTDQLLDVARKEIVRVVDDYRLLSSGSSPVPQTRNVA